MKPKCQWITPQLSASFVDQWWAWWGILKNPMDQLNIAGANGAMLVVLALAWWGTDVGVEGRASQDANGWLAAVREVMRALQALQDVVQGPRAEK